MAGGNESLLFTEGRDYHIFYVLSAVDESWISPEVEWMALIEANELKRKMLIEVDGQPYPVIEVLFATPTARGASTMMRTKLRHLITDAVLEKSLKSSE